MYETVGANLANVAFLQVPVLMLLENGPLRETADLCSQPWFKLYHFLSGWRPDVDMAAWAADAKSLAGEITVSVSGTAWPCHLAAAM